MNDIIPIEQAILSTFLQSLTPEHEELIQLMNSSDFYLPNHQEIFKVIMDFVEHEKTIDEHLLILELERKNQFDENTLLNILSATPFHNIDTHVKEVIDARKKRDILHFITIAKQELEHKSANTIADTLITQLENLNLSKDVLEPITMVQAIKEYESMKEPPKIETGIRELDEALNGGIELHQLVHIGGESGAGKTMITLQILNNVSQHFGSLFLSFEMPKWKMAKRSLRYKSTNCDFNNYFITDSGRDISDVKNTIKRWVKKHAIKFVVIDSEMKITHDSYQGQNEPNKIGDIHSILSALCQELGIVIFLITQLSKSDVRNGTMSGLGSSKSDYEADMKLFIKKDDKDDTKRLLEIKKNRQDIRANSIQLHIDTSKLIFSQFAVREVVYENVDSKIEMPQL